MLRAAARYLKRINKTDLPSPPIMSLRNIEQIPAPVHRGMTQLDRGAFVTQFSRLSVKIKNQDVGKVTKAKEMQP
jgi:hypothetical protein